MSSGNRSINKSQSGSRKHVFLRAVNAKSDWPDKDEFLDVIYWGRQILGIILGIVWGVIPMRGFVGIALFLAVSSALVYIYAVNFQSVDESSYGGPWEFLKEGFMTSFAGFLVTWIIFFTGLYYEARTAAKQMRA